jgi:anti-anti-sigma regulatory factor
VVAEIVVDMSTVSYTDTSGVATLLEVLKLAGECSATLRLAGLNGQCRMLLEIMEVEQVFGPSGGEVDLH